jgi:hypothetical protein
MVWWNQDGTPCSEYQESRLEETWHHCYTEAWWWQHHAMGMFFSRRDWETSQDWGKDERSNVQRYPWWKTCSRLFRTSDWGKGSPSQQDNNPKHTVKTMQEWLRDKSVNVLELPSQSPDLNPIGRQWGDLKIQLKSEVYIHLSQINLKQFMTFNPRKNSLSSVS